MFLVASALAAVALSLATAPSDVLLRVGVANLDRAEFQQWLRARPFAAVLPIQPMLVVPLDPPLVGVELTFRRKPNSEKGGTDGGIRFLLTANEESATTDGVADGQLLATRLVQGQYTDKIFSERMLLRRVIADLEKLPSSCGAVLSVVDSSRSVDSTGGP